MMGSFAGHASDGAFFMAFSLWWTVAAFSRYFRCRRRGTLYTSTVTFQCPCVCGRLKYWPIEPCLKIFFVTVGFTSEIITGFENGKFTDMGNAQHATMLFYFGSSGVIDLLMHFKAPIPPDTDYVVTVMALTIEGILFNFHLHGRSQLDILIHTLLLYTIICSVVAVLVEMCFRHNMLSTLMRAYFILLQGTWLWQIAFILYNPSPRAVPWKKDDHNENTLATLLFAWHGLADLVILLIIGVVVKCIGCDWEKHGDTQTYQALLDPENMENASARNLDDSESDLEKGVSRLNRLEVLQ